MDTGQDRFMSTLKVGPKSQIVIPKEVREMFGIKPGDSVVLMADSKRGIAIQKADVLNGIADAIFSGRGKEVLPHENEADLPAFAKTIKKSLKKGAEQQ